MRMAAVRMTAVRMARKAKAMANSIKRIQPPQPEGARPMVTHARLLTHTVTSRQRLCQTAGMTLLELMLALVGTGLVAVGIVSMFGAVTYATDQQQDQHSLIAKRQTVVARIDHAIGRAEQVLEQDDGELVLWIEDKNDNDQPEASELQLIEHDADQNRVFSYTADAQGSDSTLSLGGTLDRLIRKLFEDDVYKKEIWARGVTDWSVQLDADDPADTKFVSHRITLTQGPQQTTAVSAAGLGQ
jgi:type II secretory pathway pseudopilin PulG